MNVKAEPGIWFAWNFTQTQDFVSLLFLNVGRGRRHALTCLFTPWQTMALDWFDSPLFVDFFFLIVSGNIVWLWDNNHLILPKRNLGIFWSAFVCFPNLLWGHAEPDLMGGKSRSEENVDFAEWNRKKKDIHLQDSSVLQDWFIYLLASLFALLSSLTTSARHSLSLPRHLHPGENTSVFFCHQEDRTHNSKDWSQALQGKDALSLSSKGRSASNFLL